MYDILYDIIVPEPSTFFYCIMWACDNVTVTFCDDCDITLTLTLSLKLKIN